MTSPPDGLLDPRNGPDFDLPPCTGARTYVIASTPRSGSTLLARLLWGTERVGAPKEYLNPMQIRDWEVRLGSRASSRLHRFLVGPAVGLAGRGRWTDARLRDHLARVRARRSGGTDGGFFGLKLHWHHYQQWFGSTGRSVDRWLDSPVFVRIRRPDAVAQAVSWARALQTGAWIEKQLQSQGQAVRVPPVYNRRLIAARLADLQAAEAGWDGVLAGRAVCEVDYDALVADPRAVVRDVLDFLGVRSPDPGPLELPLTRQSDALSSAWIERFRTGW